MKKTFLLILCLSVLFVSTSLQTKQSKNSRSYEKTIFLEIDINNDSALFKPYSKAWLEPWSTYNPTLLCIESGVMNEEDYLSAFKGHKDNLWTILHPKIIEGSITPYSPFDPRSFYVKDQGDLRYPIEGTEQNENFINSQKFRNKICYYLGNFGRDSDIPLVNIYGEDSIDSYGNFVYPPRDYYWYTDKEIIKYKVRIKVIIKKNGDEKMRVVEAIAPIVNEYDQFEQLIGEKELLWLDYKELKPYLKEGYFFDESGKPVTYRKYFERLVE